jgi:hypothetical protein
VQRLADPRHVPVAEDPEAAAEEPVLDAVPLDPLGGQKSQQRLRDSEPKNARAWLRHGTRLAMFAMLVVTTMRRTPR